MVTFSVYLENERLIESHEGGQMKASEGVILVNFHRSL